MKFLPYCLPFLFMKLVFSQFPFEELTNVKDYHTLSNLYNNWMCPSSRCCSCDTLCMITKTCCINAFWNNSYTNLDNYLQHLTTLSKKYKDLECVDAFPYMKEQGFGSNHYYMVTACVIGASEIDKQRCYAEEKDLQNSFPVFGDNKYMYRNMFCAKCNLVTDFHFVPMRMICDHETKSKTGNCVYIVDVDSWYAKMCIPKKNKKSMFKIS